MSEKKLLAGLTADVQKLVKLVNYSDKLLLTEHRGDITKDGERVATITLSGTTFVVMEDGGGAKIGIDLSDALMMIAETIRAAREKLDQEKGGS